MEIEYIGEVLPDGHLSLDPDIAKKLSTGQKVRIRIEQIADDSRAQEKKELDPATKRLLQRLHNAPSLGVIQGSLSREAIHGERIDERY